MDVPIDDLHAAEVVDDSDVTGVVPALLVDELVGLLLVLVVALAGAGTTVADLTTGIGLVGVEIIHLGNVDELKT